MFGNPFRIATKKDNSILFDDSNRLARILYRFRSYQKIFMKAVQAGVAVSDLLRAQFPFAMRDASFPPIIALELTNYCNLKCPYCTSPLAQRERGYMSDEVFEKVMADLTRGKKNRVQIIGNGESTLHPKFNEYIRRIGATGRFVSVVTNGQWIDENTASSLIESGIDLLEFSIDAGGKEEYERSRINGSFEKLLDNITLLNKIKAHQRSKTIINIRLMVRPSQLSSYRKEFKFWKNYCNGIMPQYVMKINNTEYSEDVFLPVQKITNSFPKCSMPFKHMEVKYTGDILMCYYTLFQMGPPGLIIGNIKNRSIVELWNSDVMKQYRYAHRKRKKNLMPVCKGCPGT